jgi:hypothetical protein
MKIKLENATDDQERSNFFIITMIEGKEAIYEEMTEYIQSKSEFKCTNCPIEWDEDYELSDYFSCDRGEYGTKKEATKFLRELIKDFKRLNK